MKEGTVLVETVSYCAGSDSIHIGIGRTQNGIAYILSREIGINPADVGFVSGNGNDSVQFVGSFGGAFQQTVEGIVEDTITYYVRALDFKTGCETRSLDSVFIIKNQLAAVQEVYPA